MATAPGFTQGLKPTSLCLAVGMNSAVTQAPPLMSQNSEDAVLLRILDCIGHGTKEFFEFGAQDGMEVNTRLLREEYGWRGHLLDGGAPDPAINLHHEFFNASNIVALMGKYGASLELDLLSVDCDFDDFFILREILLAGFRPRLLVTEFNGDFTSHQAYSVLAPLSLNAQRWTGDCYHGVSALALTRLCDAFGYELVHADKVNLFFVRRDHALALGLVLPGALSLLPTAPLIPSKPDQRGASNNTRCKPCGSIWVKIPADGFAHKALDKRLSHEAFAASLPRVVLGARQIYKHYHLTPRHTFLRLYREIDHVLKGRECKEWSEPVVAKPNPRVGRPGQPLVSLRSSTVGAFTHQYHAARS